MMLHSFISAVVLFRMWHYRVAGKPVQMAKAMRHAIEAGRLPQKLYATASSPWEGLIEPQAN
jgi:thiazole synthase ThiGH ThiG subunit